jgi:transcriptional regulator with XRE-family HTH domain
MTRKKATKPRPINTADDRAIGIRIRARRITLGLSQEQLGTDIGVAFQQVQKYERGSNRISGARLLKLCTALEIDPNRLLGWNGPVAPPVKLNGTLELARRLETLTSAQRRLLKKMVGVVRALDEDGRLAA